jgi:phosphate transport system substrate-binding protein
MSTLNLSPIRAPWQRLPRAAAMLLLCGAVNVHAEEVRIGGTGAALGTMQMLAEAYAKSQPQTRITVLPSMGSSGGIKAVLSGAIQLGLSSRPLAEAEVQGGATGFEYGRTPLVFATASTNKTLGLSTQNLVDMYAAKTEQWPDGSKVRLVLRPVGDSDSELIKALSPEMREAQGAAEQRKGMSFAVTDQDAANSIEKVPGALGPSTLAQILSEKRQIKALRLNGVVPDAGSIASGSYPLQKRLWLINGPKTPAAAQSFVSFVQSADGRAILVQTGHWVK